MKSKKFRTGITFAFFIGIYAIASGLCFYQSYATIGRYMRHEVERIVSTFNNRSALIPVVILTLDLSRKKTGSRNFSALPEMFFSPLLDSRAFPEWAYVETHNSDRHLIAVNKIDYCFLLKFFSLSVTRPQSARNQKKIMKTYKAKAGVFLALISLKIVDRSEGSK